ncbi:DUF6439 family protein [Crocosphaera sp. XPORK-15E]|nr:DUF6439 family protein [Crocosphaera sp. XPORK-15E]MEA5532699.1 DUF6439 family protein [Crocosphaera sp. XPORK-15E]
MAPMTQLSHPDQLKSANSLELAQALAEQLTITPNDWHRLKGDRQAQAKQQLAAALVFLLKEQPQEALAHLNQAAGWLDRSVSPLPCPGHGNSK